MPENVIGRECKHVIYTPGRDGQHDMLTVKEYEYLDDGTRRSNMRRIFDYQRPFWITRPGFRNHEDKKESEALDRLQVYHTKQIFLTQSIGRALGRPGTRGSLKMACRSPYVYGADISAPALVKRAYMEKYPTYSTENLIAVVDIEADVVDGTNEPIMVSITFKNRAFLAVTRKFLAGVSNPEAKIQAAFEQYLGKYKSERNIELEVALVANAGDAAARVIEKAHAWRPDFMVFWNIDYDIPSMNAHLERYGYDLAQVWSDPATPPEFRYCRYIQGPSQKVTASGRVQPLAPAERWHWLDTPASFIAIDAMCVYLKLRIAGGKEPSYALDRILEKHLGIRKLKFEQANEYTGLDWHQFMQRNYKVEYCIYNLFDCISVELLDEATKDLALLISSQCGHSEYRIFNSQPKRTCDDLHFVYLKHGEVIATASDQMEDENDVKYGISLKGWIITLESHLLHNSGQKLLQELPDLATNIRTDTADADLASTYPHGQLLLNISKSTTHMELSFMRDIEQEAQRAATINLSGGYVNAVELYTSIYRAPTFDTLLREFQAQLG